MAASLSSGLRQIRQWVIVRRTFLLPILFATLAVIICTALYSEALELLRQQAAGVIPFDIRLNNPLLPLYLFSVSLIVLVMVTYLVLQMRSGVIEMRERIEREKASFIRLAADTIRTPLTGLRWLLELMLSGEYGPVSDQQRESITWMSKAMERVIGHANELLHIMKLSGSIITYRPAKAHLNEVIASSLTRMLPLANAKGQHINSKALPDDEIVIDAPLIQHVVEVLLGSSIDHAAMQSAIDVSSAIAQGVATIRIAYEANAEEQALKADMRITDGIEHESSAAATAHLTLCREILQAAGGQLQFDRVGNRSTFVITLKSDTLHPTPHHA